MTLNLGPFLGGDRKNGRSDRIRTCDPYPPRILSYLKTQQNRAIAVFIRSRSFAFGFGQSWANLGRTIWRNLSSHTHCRVCEAPLENGGCYVPLVGKGYCPACHYLTIEKMWMESK